MDLHNYLEKNKYIKWQLYICRRLPPTRQKIGHHKGIEFANFRVIKAWQFSMYNVKRDFILESETLMGTHWIKRCETCPFRATPTILAGPNSLYPQS